MTLSILPGCDGARSGMLGDVTTAALGSPLSRVSVRRAGAAMRGYVCRAPMSTAFAVVLLGTTIALRHFVTDGNALLEWASTNVDNLAARPLRSLVASALFLPGGQWLPYAGALAATLVPLERRFGAWRAAGIAVSGHVLATLVTEGGVAAGIAWGALPRSEAHQLDVGVSYLIWTAAGAAVLLAPRRWRLPLGAAVALGVLVPLAVTPNMTTAGHALCVAIGGAWWPLMRRWTAQPVEPTVTGLTAPSGS